MEWLFGLVVGLAIIMIGLSVLAWFAAVVIGLVGFAAQLIIEKLGSQREARSSNPHCR